MSLWRLPDEVLNQLRACRFTTTKSRKQLTIATSALLGAAIQPLRKVGHEASNLNGSATERVRQRYLGERHLQYVLEPQVARLSLSTSANVLDQRTKWSSAQVALVASAVLKSEHSSTSAQMQHQQSQNHTSKLFHALFHCRLKAFHFSDINGANTYY